MYVYLYVCVCVFVCMYFVIAPSLVLSALMSHLYVPFISFLLVSFAENNMWDQAFGNYISTAGV